MSNLRERLARLGITVFERGWLSSNNILIVGRSGDAALVDTGYSAHAEQTVALVDAALHGAPLTHIFNTHLHSDHCGGNAALHVRWRSAVSVPSAVFAAAASWDEDILLFRATDQRCERFPVHGSLEHGTCVALGDWSWEVHRAPGHDPDAIMLFQPDERVLISGDALWEHRVAVIFPELTGRSGFDAALEALDTIQRLAPDVVIPGHGRPFADSTAALTQSRERVSAFSKTPAKHTRYAVRALTMFHMLEHRHYNDEDLVNWIVMTPLLGSLECAKDRKWVRGVVDTLVTDGTLKRAGNILSV